MSGMKQVLTSHAKWFLFLQGPKLHHPATVLLADGLAAGRHFGNTLQEEQSIFGLQRVLMY